MSNCITVNINPCIPIQPSTTPDAWLSAFPVALNDQAAIAYYQSLTPRKSGLLGYVVASGSDVLVPGTLRRVMVPVVSLLLLLCSVGLSAQAIVRTVGIVYTNGTPTHTPSAQGSLVALDTVSRNFFEYSAGTWLNMGERLQSISGCAAPAYTPTKAQSTFVINACDSMYVYRSSAWRHVNKGGGGAGVTDGDKTDIRVTSGGTVWTVDTSAITAIKIASGAVTMPKIAQSGATTNQVIKWNGSAWAPGADATGGVTDGDKGDIDVTSSGTVWTVDTSAVTWTKLSQAVRDSINAGGVSTITRSTNGDSLIVGNGKVRDQDSPNNNAWYLGNNMKWLDYYFQRVSTQTSDLNIAIIGDSKTEITTLSFQLKNALGRKNLMAGNGWTPITPVGFDHYNGTNINSIAAANWTLVGNGNSGGGKNLSLYSAVSTVSSTSIGFTPATFPSYEWDKYTKAEVVYFGASGAASFEIWIDGVLNATINASAPTGLQTYTISGLSDNPHTFRITPLGAGVEILGVKLSRVQPSNLFKGILVHTMGHSSASTTDWLTMDTSIFNPQFRNLNTHVLVFFLGTNDKNILRSSPQTFKTAVKALNAKFKAINPNMDIVWWGQPDVDTTSIFVLHPVPATTKAYNNILRQVALEDSIAFFDIDQLAGDYAESEQRDFLSDGLHESAYGSYVEARGFIDGIERFNGTNVVEVLRRDNAFTITNTGSIAQLTTQTATLGAVTAQTVVAGTGSRLSGLQFNNGTTSADMYGIALPIRLLTSNQGAIVNNFSIESNFGSGVLRQWNQSSNILNINNGWQSPASPSTHANFVNITGTLNMPTAVQSNTINGITYRPTLTNLGGARHRSLRIYSGDALFGLTSGSLKVGRDSVVNESAILDVGRNDGLNYKGVLLPRLTTSQRDSIVTGIASYTITNAGSGYGSTIPTLNFSHGTGAATVTLSGGSVSTVVPLRAGQYVTAPTITVVGIGSGATITATLRPLPNGLLIFNTTNNRYEVRDSINAVWNTISTPGGATAQIQYNNTGAFDGADSIVIIETTADRMGVGTTSPTARLHVQGTGSSGSVDALRVDNSLGNALFEVENGGKTIAAGQVQIGGALMPNNNAGTAGQVLVSQGSLTFPVWRTDTLNFMFAASNEDDNLTTGTAKITFRAPHQMTLVGIRASVNTAPVGSTIIVDVNEAGTSIFSTRLSIDASEKTSVTAAVPPVFSDTAIANDAEITVDIDQVGSSTAGKGLKITLYYTK
jgi:hypothetical protein